MNFVFCCGDRRARTLDRSSIRLSVKPRHEAFHLRAGGRSTRPFTFLARFTQCAQVQQAGAWRRRVDFGFFHRRRFLRHFPIVHATFADVEEAVHDDPFTRRLNQQLDGGRDGGLDGGRGRGSGGALVALAGWSVFAFVVFALPLALLLLLVVLGLLGLWLLGLWLLGLWLARSRRPGALAGGSEYAEKFTATAGSGSGSGAGSGSGSVKPIVLAISRATRGATVPGTGSNRWSWSSFFANSPCSTSEKFFNHAVVAPRTSSHVCAERVVPHRSGCICTLSL